MTAAFEGTSETHRRCPYGLRPTLYATFGESVLSVLERGGSGLGPTGSGVEKTNGKGNGWDNGSPADSTARCGTSETKVSV